MRHTMMTDLSPGAAGVAIKEATDPICRVAVLGQTGVGKTALTVRFLTKRFIGEYCPTLESVYKYHCLIDNEESRLEILDTAGQDAFINESHLLWADCFVLVYSITDRRSFDYIPKVYRKLQNIRGSLCPGILVGNKTDLLHERAVTSQEGQVVAEKFRLSWLEVSAAEGDDVDKVAGIFQDLGREFRKQHTVLSDKYSSSSSSRKNHNSSSFRLKNAIKTVILGGRLAKHQRTPSE